MAFEVGNSIREIQTIVDNCDMNLWISCLLNNQGFLIQNPVMKMKLGQRDPRQRFVRDQTEMAKHLGTASFSRVLLWSYHTYNLKDVAYFPPDFHFRLDLTGQQGGMSSIKKRKKGAMATMNSGKDIHLPELKQIQEFLEDSITSLEEDDFFMLQSLLVDFHVLSRWTQPFSMKVKKNYVEGYDKDDNITSTTSTTTDKTKINGSLNNAWAHYKKTMKSTTDNTRSDRENNDDNDDNSSYEGHKEYNDDSDDDDSAR